MGTDPPRPQPGEIFISDRLELSARIILALCSTPFPQGFSFLNTAIARGLKIWSSRFQKEKPHLKLSKMELKLLFWLL